MKVFEAIEARRSVKHYDTEAVMTDAEFEQLMQAVLLSPTSFNTQNWRFLRITDSDQRAKVCEVAWGQAQVTDACEVLLLCADLKAWEKSPERYWRNADETIQSILLPMIDDFYRGKEQTQRDEAMRSCGIAAQTIMLASKAMGYDTCPMIGFDAEAMAELINLPEDHVIGLMVAIGKAKEPAKPRGGQLPLEEVLKENAF